MPIEIVQAEAVSYGNGRYVLAGSGPIETSEDGSSWQPHPLDCALTGGCITDPSGGVHQGYHASLLFAEGRFFTDQLSSADGATWEDQPNRFPLAYVDGHFLGQLGLASGLETWSTGGDIETLHIIRPAKAAVTAGGRDIRSVGVLDADSPLPDRVDVEFEDGLSCLTARCVIVAGRLLLIPPVGTPPLIDHVPRAFDGKPLLSDACPFSSMIACEDYATRSGCKCQPDAPRSPANCDDVSQYRCAGQFIPRPDEWQVDEVAEGGCTCDAIDPNQPATCGSTCAPADATCKAPLQCLGVETESFGFPVPQRFVCTATCTSDADCPTWQASGFCAGPVHLRCGQGGICQPRSCE